MLAHNKRFFQVCSWRFVDLIQKQEKAIYYIVGALVRTAQNSQASLLSRKYRDLNYFLFSCAFMASITLLYDSM